MKPGEGYLIHMTAPMTLTYPAGGTSAPPKLARTTGAGLSETLSDVCPPVQNTPYLTYAYGPVALNGVAAAVGTVVEAVNPRGDVVGCQVITTAGALAQMAVYGEDTAVLPAIPGMRAGETVAFRAGGAEASVTPPLLWSNDLDSHQVSLSAYAPFTLTLSPGWNLISLPLAPPRMAVTEALSGITGAYDLVYGYHAEDTLDPWKKYNTTAPDFLNDLKEMAPGRGYWINATAACTWTLP